MYNNENNIRLFSHSAHFQNDGLTTTQQPLLSSSPFAIKVRYLAKCMTLVALLVGEYELVVGGVVVGWGTAARSGGLRAVSLTMGVGAPTPVD